MRRALSFVVLLGLVFPPAAFSEEPFEDLPLDKALEKAGQEKKVVMIDFFTTWCGPCKMLDKNTWPNADVKKLLKEKAISLKVDAEKNRELSQKYRITSYPQIVFLKPDGTEIDRLVGYLPPETFVNDASGPLAGKDSITSKREALQKNPEDPLARLKLGDALVQRGKLDEALVEYLWCFDVGAKARPEFAGVRYGFLLGKISQLARTYPPAMKALEERRENAVRVLMQPPAKEAAIPTTQAAGPQDALRDAAVMVLMIDRALARQGKALAVYDELKAKGDSHIAARQAMAMQVVDLLWTEKRYEEIVSDGGDPTKRLEESIANFQRSMGNPMNRDPRLTDFLRQQAINTIGKYYEALLATGKSDAADALRDRILQFDGSGRAYAALITHAIRAGKPAAARQLIAQGMVAAPENERPLIEAAAKNIPADATTTAPSSPSGAKPAG